MLDWLGNELVVGGPVLYSSASTLTGMNLGELLFVDAKKIQIRLWAITRRASGATYMTSRIVTLHAGTGAYKTVTKYVGNLPVKDIE